MLKKTFLLVLLTAILLEVGLSCDKPGAAVPDGSGEPEGTEQPKYPDVPDVPEPKPEDDAEPATAADLMLSLDRENGEFAVGETVRIYAVSAKKKVKATVHILANGKELLGTREVIIPKGERTCIFKESFTGPVHRVLKIGSADISDTVPVGFIVGPRGFSPGYSHPLDFRSFWDGQIAALRTSEPVVTLEDASTHYTHSWSGNGYTSYDLTISMPEGRPVRAYVVYPQNAAKGSLPINIKLHAAGASYSNRSTADVAVTAAKYGGGCIGVDINAHGIDNNQPESYYVALQNGELKGYADRVITGHESYYFRLMYLRLVRLLDYLCTLPEWDGKRIMVFGESQGGGQSFAIAGLDTRVSAVCAQVPALTDLGAKHDGRPGSWPFVLESSVNAGNWEKVNEILPYYDVAQFTRYSKARFWVEIGLLDVTCPAAAVWSACNGIPESADNHLLSWPFRPHNPPAEPYLEDWNTKVKNARIAWMNEYLK